jgi:hypothetical protein
MKNHFNTPVLALLIPVVAMLCGCSKSGPKQQPDGTSETLRFVFMADSRGDSLGFMVDTAALNPIIRQIDTLNPPPSFILFGGDMCYRGYMNGSYTFQTFKNLFSKLTAKKIPLYTVIGNHELYHEHSKYGFLHTNQVQFQEDFSENPANGPAGYEHLVYSFADQASSSFFAVLDPYFFNTDTLHPNGLGGHIDSTQMAWLKAQVAQTTATHKFLFIHTPYYYVSNDPEEPSAADTSYTILWAFLDANKFDLYACGHSHLYARRTIDNSVLPDPQTIPPTSPWQNNVVHLLNGTCGAGPSTGTIDPDIRTAWNVHNDALTYYFSVVDVCGNTVTVNSYSGYTGAYSVFDTFTITK